ncbi:MAG: hypothetical protein WBM04_13080 [Candidatus Korobacteraceae bacterium]
MSGPINYHLVPENQLVAVNLFNSNGVTAMNMSTGQWIGGYGPLPGGNYASPYGLASVTPYPTPYPIGGIGHRVPFPIPSVPPTTIFILNGQSVGVQNTNDVSAVSPSLTNPDAATVTTVISIQQPFSPQQNGLAVYQKAVPANELYIGPPFPIFIYVLGSEGQPVGETIFRYQMNSNPPYQPAGLQVNPTDPTFIAGGSTLSGVSVLTTNSGIQGLACSADGTLAVSDGPVIWLFDAETGALKDGIYLTPWNLAAYTLAFGPDGNLYVLAGLPSPSNENVPSSITILKFLGSTAIPYGMSLWNPVLISPPPIGGIGMTVGGSATAPIVYLSGYDEYDNSNILTFSGLDGSPITNSFQDLGVVGSPLALAIVNFYTLTESPASIPL